MKGRSSDNIIYTKLFIKRCSTNKSLDDLYFFVSTKNSRFDIIGVQIWSLFFLVISWSLAIDIKRTQKWTFYFNGMSKYDNS